MPPRYSYWTILAGGLPTAFRAAEREELLPTFHRIRDKHPDAEMKWFARGRLWESPEEAQAIFNANAIGAIATGDPAASIAIRERRSRSQAQTRRRAARTEHRGVAPSRPDATVRHAVPRGHRRNPPGHGPHTRTRPCVAARNPPAIRHASCRPPSKPTGPSGKRPPGRHRSPPGHPARAPPGHHRNPPGHPAATPAASITAIGHATGPRPTGPRRDLAAIETHRAIGHAHRVVAIETHRAIGQAHCLVAVETHRAIG